MLCIPRFQRRPDCDSPPGAKDQLRPSAEVWGARGEWSGAFRQTTNDGSSTLRQEGKLVRKITGATCVGVTFVILSVLLSGGAPAQEYWNSSEHFEALKRAANGGTKITFDKLPDWTGIWTRSTEPVFKFDPAQPSVRCPAWTHR
jgi:hypothetical protein